MKTKELWEVKIEECFLELIEDRGIPLVIVNPDTLKHVVKELIRGKIKVGMLRQWLNEDRITEPGRMVTNEQLEHWLI